MEAVTIVSSPKSILQLTPPSSLAQATRLYLCYLKCHIFVYSMLWFALVSNLELSTARELAARRESAVRNQLSVSPNVGHPSDPSRALALNMLTRSCILLSIQSHDLATTRCPYHQPRKFAHLGHHPWLSQVSHCLVCFRAFRTAIDCFSPVGGLPGKGAPRRKQNQHSLSVTRTGSCLVALIDYITWLTIVDYI